MRIRRLAMVLLALGAALAPLSAAMATKAFPKAVRAGPPAFDERDDLVAAVEASSRSAENRARDVWRHPLESLTFWGLRPGDSIVELAPGAGYWTEILAPFAKAAGGRYVATGADLDDPATPEGARKATAAFQARFGVQTVGFGPRSGPLATPGSADFILTARSITTGCASPAASTRSWPTPSRR